MQQIQEQISISIPAACELDKVYDISIYAHGAKKLHITVAAHASVILHDRESQDLESLELTLEKGAQVFLVSQCSHRIISINCYAETYFSCVQVLSAQEVRQAVQRFILFMQEAGSKAYVRILPSLRDNQFENKTLENDEAVFSYIFSHPTDENIELTITLIAFHIPKPS